MRIGALDGLRGFALLGMLAWHAHLDWVRGGFARMTIFFVLSGFLGAQSLLRLRSAGHERTWLVFLRRRARRLLPMTVLGIAAAVAVTVTVGSESARRTLTGDAASVLVGMSNWRLIASSRSYGALFESPSALQHFWSLSAEEQCFWLLPPLVALAAALAPRAVWAALASLSAALLAVPLFVVQSPDTVYYGTVNRAGEFLAGVALAHWLHHSRARSEPDRTRHAVGLLGTASLVVLVAAMLLIERDAPGLYRGGSALVVVPVLAVLVAVDRRSGSAPRALSLPWLTALGRWSFSIYVLHWPIYLLMDGGRVPLAGPALAVSKITVGIALGAVAHHLLERPLLEPSPGTRATVPRWRRDAVVLPAAGVLGVLAVVVSASVPVPAPVYDFEAAKARIAAAIPPTAEHPSSDTANPSAGVGVAADPAVLLSDGAGPRPIRVGVFGGSSAVLLAAAMTDWSTGVAEVTAVRGWAEHGCGFLTTGKRLGGVFDGRPAIVEPDDVCLGWRAAWLEAARTNQVQVAVVVTGVWETSDWWLPGRQGPVSIDDGELRATLAAEIEAAIDDLVAAGVRVLITTPPNVGPGVTGDARAARGLPPEHVRRVAEYRDLLRAIVSGRPDVDVVEYGEYVDALDRAEAARAYPDGIHPTDAAARQGWSEVLGPALLRTIEQIRQGSAVDPAIAPA